VTIDSWLPIGLELSDGDRTRRVVFSGRDWQIVETQSGRRTLVVREELAVRWIESALIDAGCLSRLTFGDSSFQILSSGPSQVLSPVSEADSPNTKAEALAFAQALKATRELDASSPLQDSIYVERISRLLPTYSISSRTDDDVVLGFWLTGGAHTSAKAIRRLSQMMSWLGENNLREVVSTAGLMLSSASHEGSNTITAQDTSSDGAPSGREDGLAANLEKSVFELAGRPDLTTFFNEHVIDILKNSERYKALGINFPSAVALHGPPGCGKTYAIEQLVDFLQWPSFQIDASSVASPYIHETSRKIAQVFEQAIKAAPSVLVIDEMEAFLTDREVGSGHHRVEEVAEFLRRIPEATKNRVLIVAMTNRIDMIDPAILRRGRFDHIIKVDFASAAEIRALLKKLMLTLPKEPDLDIEPLVAQLVGRPISDVTFVVREAARLAARAGKNKLDQISLVASMSSAPARDREGGARNQIGFV